MMHMCHTKLPVFAARRTILRMDMGVLVASILWPPVLLKSSLRTHVLRVRKRLLAVAQISHDNVTC